MAEFGKIDDSLDASFQGWPDETPGLGSKFGELALSFYGLEFLPAKILKILKDQFAPGSRFARIEYLFSGVRLKLKKLESDVGAQGSASEKALQEIRAKLEKPQFDEAVAVAAEEAARATNREKIDQFVSVLAGSLSPSEWGEHDVASIIRDVAQLNVSDINVLGLLMGTFGGVMKTTPNLHDPNVFTDKMDALRSVIAGSGFHRDDFYSNCARLSGFGLAVEEIRNPNMMQLSDRCYRPTRRGMALLSYLDACRNNVATGT